MLWSLLPNLSWAVSTAPGDLPAGRSRAGRALPRHGSDQDLEGHPRRQGADARLPAEGDFFGEPCLLDGGPREEMAEAMDASIAVEIEREQLDQLLQTNGSAYTFTRP